MAITALFEGSADVVNSSTLSLVLNSAGSTAVQTDGVFQIWLDLVNTTASNNYELTLWEKVVTAGTQRKFAMFCFQGPQGVPIWVSPAIVLMNGWDVTLMNTQTSASNSAFRRVEWSIRQIS